MAAASAATQQERGGGAGVCVTLGHELGWDFGCDLVLNNATAIPKATRERKVDCWKTVSIPF
jgi:hypothetical protein